MIPPVSDSIKGPDPANCGPPDMRLKLTAPVLEGRIAFVILTAYRREDDQWKVVHRHGDTV